MKCRRLEHKVMFVVKKKISVISLKYTKLRQSKVKHVPTWNFSGKQRHLK